MGDDSAARRDDELAVARAERDEWKRRYDELANGSHVVIGRIDATGRVTYVSPSVRTVLGYEPEELVGKVGFDFIDAPQQAERRTGFAAGLENGRAPVVTARVRRKDGGYVWMEYRTDVLRDADGKITGFLSTSHDVTARHEAEEALRRSEENFEAFVRAMPVPAIIQQDLRFELVNRAFTDVFGHTGEALLGTPIFDVVANADRAYVAQYVDRPSRERAGARTREHLLLHADGTRIAVEVTSVPVFFHGRMCQMAVVHDLRERKQLEAQLVTADRMASLGRLAAAVAHEINNPLAYILGSLALIQREIEQLALAGEHARQVDELLSNVQEGAKRIRDVVQDLRVLSRERADVFGQVDLSHVLDLCATMADHEARHRARMVKDYETLPPVRGAEARLGQVFLNLLVNAAQAIPEGAPADNEIRIEARASNDAVTVDVVDSGTGVADGVAERIFDPFFTTKAEHGTGLGLSISQHIVRSLGGSIAVLPNEPRGSRFRVVLPRADLEPVAPAAAPPEAPASEHAGVRVLVVEDEPQLARTIARLLQPREVDVATGGKQALARIDAGTRYDVILCDVHMNEVSGLDVFEHIRRAGTGLDDRVIFMTSGLLSKRAADLLSDSQRPVLEKPFDAEMLESAIAAVLDAARHHTNGTSARRSGG